MKDRTYRYFSGKPLYSFGYGLSYTTFAYSNLKVPTQEIKAGDPVTIEGTVKNTGSVAGDEVAELYLTQPKAFQTPIRVLAGFQRVHAHPRPVDSGPLHHRSPLARAGRRPGKSCHRPW